MISSRSFLIRGMREWITANHLTPHIIVDASLPDVGVPMDYVDADQRIILNVAERAINALEIDTDAVRFQARFSGVVHDIYVPIEAVQGIYCHESGRGLSFSTESDRGDAIAAPLDLDKVAEMTQKAMEQQRKRPAQKGPPHLILVQPRDKSPSNVDDT